jgi:hypothetical protein
MASVHEIDGWEKPISKEYEASHQIVDVPDLLWPHTGMCGFTSTAMVQQYWWGKEHTESRMLEIFKSKLDRPELARERYPNAQLLAQITKEIIVPTPKAIVLAGDYYKRKDRDPHDVLKKFIFNDIPCIVRIPGHFMVAVGYSESTYTFHNPSNTKIPVWDKFNFDTEWRKQDNQYPDNSRHLILAIYPADKDQIAEKQKENEEKSNASKLLQEPW